MNNQEIEVRFPDIDKEALLKKLRELGAEDHGEDLLEEMIFYSHPDGSIPDRFVRVRKARGRTELTYKNHYEHSATGTMEIQLDITDMETAKDFMLAIGWTQVRRQQKKRHDFVFNDCEISIDEFPLAVSYVEIEGPSEEALKETAAFLGLSWEDVYFKNALMLLKEKRGLDVEKMKTYTFEKIEYVENT